MPKKAENEVVRPVVLHVGDEADYTLEFTRDTVRWAESRGFRIEDIDNYPMTKIPEFFYYAFRAHHKNVAREKTDKIIFDDWGGIGGIPDGLLERLALLYAEPFKAHEESTKNSRVTVEL